MGPLIHGVPQVAVAEVAGIGRQFIDPSGLRVRGSERFNDDGRNYLLHPFFYCHVGLRDAWQWKADGLHEGHFRLWEFLLVKWWNDYTFGALFH